MVYSCCFPPGHASSNLGNFLEYFYFYNANDHQKSIIAENLEMVLE
jgi:membrane-associated PAP2 superfamily phosphatase